MKKILSVVACATIFSASTITMAGWQAQTDAPVDNIDKSILTINSTATPWTDNQGSSGSKYSEYNYGIPPATDFIATSNNIPASTTGPSGFARAKIYNIQLSDLIAEAQPQSNVSLQKKWKWNSCDPVPAKLLYAKISMRGSFVNNGNSNNLTNGQGTARAKCGYGGKITAEPTDGSGNNAVGASFNMDLPISGTESQRISEVTPSASWGSAGWQLGISCTVKVGDLVDGWAETNFDTYVFRGNFNNVTVAGNQPEMACTVDLRAMALAKVTNFGTYAEAVSTIDVTGFQLSESIIP